MQKKEKHNACREEVYARQERVRKKTHNESLARLFSKCADAVESLDTKI